MATKADVHLQKPRIRIRPQWRFGLTDWKSKAPSFTHQGYNYDLGFIRIEIVAVRGE